MPLDEKSCVLIADDAKIIRGLLTQILNDLGFNNLVEAQDGEDAWQKLTDEKNNIKIFMCDWNMPKLTGLELLKLVRADTRFRDMPFIMITAETDFEHASSALFNGADAYITKPFDTLAIRAALIQAIEIQNETLERQLEALESSKKKTG